MGLSASLRACHASVPGQLRALTFVHDVFDEYVANYPVLLINT